MRRVGNLYERIADPENLRLAFWKACKGKRARPEVLEYAAALEDNLLRLRQQLQEESVEVGHYHFFTVHDPKERLICAASFPERVLHHAIMNLCEPVLERYAIHDSYACRRDKGLHAAVRRAQAFARRFPWYLKLDVHKYFDSVDHETLLALLARRFKDPALLKLLRRLLETYETESGRGLPIGNLISQHCANLYLGPLDHWIKERLRVRGYVRYMDDFVLWGQVKADLQGDLSAIADFLKSELRLTLKDNVQLNRSERGIPFLGYRVFPGRLMLGAKARQRFSHKLRGYEKEWQRGEWSEADLQRHMEALLAYVRFADTLGFRRQVVGRSSLAA